MTEIDLSPKTFERECENLVFVGVPTWQPSIGCVGVGREQGRI